MLAMGSGSSYICYLFTVLLLLGRQTNVVSCLYVDPPSLAEREGDEEVHFFCLESQGGSQASGITWRGPNGDLYTPGTPTGNERISAEGYRLTLYNVVREDSGSYECFRSSEDSATGELLVYALPTILNPMPIQEIYFGMTSLLLCEIDAGNPPATVYWLHITYNNTTGAQIITEITADWNPRFTIVQNGLQISDVRVTDEGVYRCYVQNNRGQDVLDIRASFVESPQFVNDGVELSVLLTSGESASLDCTAAGAPSPNVSWSVPPDSQLGHSTALNSSVLVVQLSNEADEGEYVCTAQNEAGFIRRIFTLKLAIPPEPPVKNRNMMIQLQKELKINCSVRALPRPDFKWFLGSTLLPESTWTTIYNDVMGISTLTFEFEKEDVDTECKIQLACIASNTYGTSEQHFTLTTNENIDCSAKKAGRTISSTPNPSPNILVTDSELAGIQDSNSGGDMSDKTFKIIIGSFTVAATVIVIGVVILVVYFLKHFCLRKKYSGQLKSANPCVSHYPDPNLDPNNSSHVFAHSGASFSTTSSLHHVETGGGEFTGIRAGQRHESVDSGVIMSNHSYPSRRTHNNPNEITPPLPARSTPSTSSSSTDPCAEGMYHRLDHKLPSVSSFGSSLGSHSKVRLLSVSSATDSNSVFLSSQMSTASDYEDCIGSGATTTTDRDTQKKQFFIGQQPHQLDSFEHSTVTGRRDPDTDSVGMISNPSYGSHKLKIMTSNNEPPHVYEKVA